MGKKLIAKVTMEIKSSLRDVWEALINPSIIKEYMFGTTVISEWKQGSVIVWKGIWQGKEYEDKGIILSLIPEKLIQYSHYSPLSGLPDEPENYHNITIELFDEKTNVLVSLSQDNNETEDEKEHSEKNWTMVLTTLKKLLEQKPLI